MLIRDSLGENEYGRVQFERYCRVVAAQDDKTLIKVTGVTVTGVTCRNVTPVTCRYTSDLLNVELPQ